MILSAIAAKLKPRAKADFKGRHFEAALIVQAVSWYLRDPLSYRDFEALFLERGLEVDHSTLNRWVLAYAPLIEKRRRQFRRPHCGSIRIDETYIEVRGEWRYLYRAIDKHGTAVDFLPTAQRDLDAAKRFFRKMLQDQPLLAPDRIGTDGAGTYPPAIAESRKAGLLPHTPVHDVTQHLQQGIESDHFRVKQSMPRVGGFRSFNTARRTICGFEAMLWLRTGFGFAGVWTVREQNQMLAVCSDVKRLTKSETETGSGPSCGLRYGLRQALSSASRWPARPPGPIPARRWRGPSARSCRGCAASSSPDGASDLHDLCSRQRGGVAHGLPSLMAGNAVCQRYETDEQQSDDGATGKDRAVEDGGRLDDAST